VRGRGDRAHVWEFDIDSAPPTSWYSWANPHVNRMAGLVCGLAVAATCYMGNRDLLPFACAAQIISMIGPTYAPVLRMRVMVMLQAAVLVRLLVTYF
jgi:hypothetical protein